MDRRSFLKGLLGGVAVLTVAQTETIEGLLMPKPFSTVTHVGPPHPCPYVRPGVYMRTTFEPAVPTITWAAPVVSYQDLPSNDPWSTARLCLDDDTMWIQAGEGIGWVEMACPPLV